jgi:hypothetical protein
MPISIRYCPGYSLNTGGSPAPSGGTGYQTASGVVNSWYSVFFNVQYTTVSASLI